MACAKAALFRTLTLLWMTCFLAAIAEARLATAWSAGPRGRARAARPPPPSASCADPVAVLLLDLLHDRSPADQRLRRCWR